jgi:hypothetical protein
MVTSTQQNRDVPMAVRMQRVLAAVKRMGPQERVQLLIKAGLMTETEGADAIEHLTRSKKNGGKSKPDR